MLDYMYVTISDLVKETAKIFCIRNLYKKSIQPLYFIEE